MSHPATTRGLRAARGRAAALLALLLLGAFALGCVHPHAVHGRHRDVHRGHSVRPDWGHPSGKHHRVRERHRDRDGHGAHRHRDRHRDRDRDRHRRH
jgi:hypothetical protein